MTTLQTSRSASNVPSQLHHVDDGGGGGGSGIDYSPSSSISNLKQKLIQSATKSYSSNNSNNSLINPTMINNSSFTHSTPSTHGGSSGGDSGLDLSPNSLNNSSSNSNVNNIINNFTNLNLSGPASSNLIGHNGGNNNNNSNAQHSINGNHHLTGSSSMLGGGGGYHNHHNSDKYGVCSAGTDNKCLRCGNMVYALERIGPIKGNIYHKTCFKCLTCDRQLDLKTYYTNQIDLNERQIYCQSHAPKSGKGVFGADNLAIQNILNGPRLDVMQKVDNKPKANIDGSAKHIAHAMHAQHLVHNRKDPSQIHRFPAFPLMNPVKIKAREELRKAQQALEAKQREEEDRLLQQFMQERAQEEKKLEKEVKEEWEKRLQQIQTQYELDLKRKRDQKEQRDLTHRLRKEKEELEKNMTLKRERKREDAKRALQQMEQEATAHLVTKHSEEMIKLIKTKEAEVEATFVEPGDEQNMMMTSSNGNGNGALSSSFATPPPPKPPLRRKRDLYDDPAIFQYIDERAINVAESEQTSYTELVDQLTYGLATDLEKTRSIFRWITVKDLNSIEFGDSLTADTPLGLLRGIKFGTETYHTLFMRLCSYAGMHCVDIKGHSKSVGYEPGMKIQPGKFTNTWNAVLIDGEWRFVQCNWGARHLVMSKDKKATEQQQQQQQQQVAASSNVNNLSKTSRDKIKYQYDEHYFLPDPEEFILEFFPHNPEWQLLEQPITLEEFESLPFVRSLFFHYHLDFVNQRQAVIHTNSRGACDIKLRMPDDLKARLAFHFHLRLSNKEDSEINGVKLERYVLHTIQDDLVSFNVHVPQTGEYFIEIFASLVEPESNPFGQTFKLKCVCKYKIACEELTQRMHPLPACASGEWGPMKAARHFNIQPLTHKSAIIESQTQLIEMKFELPKLLKIHGKLHNNVLSELDKFVKHDVNQSNNQMTLYVQLPDEGQFGLDVYVRDPEYQSEKRTMSHCCKYLINFNRKSVSSYNANNSNTQAVTTIPITNSNISLHNGQSGVAIVSGAAVHKLTTPPPPVALIASPIISPATPPPHPPLASSMVTGHQMSDVMIGPNADLLNALGMTPLNYASEPVIRVDDLSATQLDLQFKMSKAVDFSFDLKYSSSLGGSGQYHNQHEALFSNGSATSSSSSTSSSKHSSSSLVSAPGGGSSFTQLKSTEIVNVKQYGYMIYFLLSLPAHKYGNYLFTVYASDDQSKTKTLPAVFTYLIKYEKTTSHPTTAIVAPNSNGHVRK